MMDITHDTTDQLAWHKHNQQRQHLVRVAQILALPATYYYLHSCSSLLFIVMSNSSLQQSITCTYSTNHSVLFQNQLIPKTNRLLLSAKIPTIVGFISLLITEKIKKYYPELPIIEKMSLLSFLLNVLNFYQCQYFHLSNFMSTKEELQEPLSFILPIIVITLSMTFQFKLLKQLSELFHYDDDRPKTFHYHRTFIETEFNEIHSKLLNDISLCPIYHSQKNNLTYPNKNIVRAILAPDGITYDHTNFVTWLAALKKTKSTSVTSPVTGKLMKGTFDNIVRQLYPNLILQDILDGDHTIECPISLTPYQQAVTDNHGHSYNERPLRYWFFKSESQSCPLCPSHQITSGELRPNYSLTHYLNKLVSNATQKTSLAVKSSH